MGIFRRKKKIKGVIKAPWSACEIQTTGKRFKVAVAGESHYQETLVQAWNESYPDTIIDAVIVPEPDNSHDPNAIAVRLVNPNGNLALVGYIPRDVAAASREAMKLLPPEHVGFACKAQMRTNPKVPDSMIGVWLNLPLATE